MAVVDKRPKARPAVNRFILFIDGNKEQRSVGRQFKVCRPVGFNRHCAENAFERERAAVADRDEVVLSGTMIQGLGQGLQNHEFLDLTLFDALHVAADIHVVQNQGSVGLGPVNMGCHDAFSGAFDQGTRFVNIHL